MMVLGDLINWAVGVGDDITAWVSLALLGDTVTSVMACFRVLYDAFPNAIKDMFFVAFGGVIFISILRGIGR